MSAASIQFLADITLNKLAADPSSPATGDMYFNTTTNKLRTYNGSTWDEMGAGGGGGGTDFQKFTASGTWTKPTGAKWCRLLMWGGGGGGGSGSRGAAGIWRSGGGGGCSGGFTMFSVDASNLPSTMTVTIGAGGTGGNARTADDVNGFDGNYGDLTTVDNFYVQANTGVGGHGRNNAGFSDSGQNGGVNPTAIVDGYAAGEGAYPQNGQAGGGISVRNSGMTRYGLSPGGAGGGGIDNTDTGYNGGRGGGVYDQSGGFFAVAKPSDPDITGVFVDGQIGLNGNPIAFNALGGGSGNGGSAGITTAAGRGGNGGTPGGGGAGGGASLNGFNSGAGGAGGRGEAWIITYF